MHKSKAYQRVHFTQNFAALETLRERSTTEVADIDILAAKVDCQRWSSSESFDHVQVVR